MKKCITLSCNIDRLCQDEGFKLTYYIETLSIGESDLFIDDLIELADESMTSSATSSSVMSTPSPVMVPQSKALIID